MGKRVSSIGVGSVGGEGEGNGGGGVRSRVCVLCILMGWGIDGNKTNEGTIYCR